MQKVLKANLKRLKTFLNYTKNYLIRNNPFKVFKKELIAEAGGWGLIKLGYNPPEEGKSGKFTLNCYFLGKNAQKTMKINKFFCSFNFFA